MKKSIKILMVVATAMVAFSFGACSDDDLGATIFDTTDYPLDRSAYTFPLDTFVKVNFQEPYNVRYMYKMNDMGLSSSDLQKNLTPCSYDQSVDLATLAKYLWFDVYKDLADEHEVFLKKYSPRIIHIVGSKSLNVSQGTETLGVAEGGLKITLYNANNLSVDNIDVMNEYFFKTMHHEFGHILDQTKSRPLAFNMLSNGQYDASGWTNTPDSVAAGRGFISPYASSQAREDWVEVLANYVTLDTLSWERAIGSAEYEWEEIDCASLSDYNKLLPKSGYDIDTIGYYKPNESGENKIYRRVCQRDANGNVIKGEDGKPIWLHRSGIDGKSLILQKLDLVRGWLRDDFGISVDAMRKMVQERSFLTDENGDFVYDRNGNLVNRFTYNRYELMNKLRDEVNKYKELQTTNE